MPQLKPGKAIGNLNPGGSVPINPEFAAMLKKQVHRAPLPHDIELPNKSGKTDIRLKDAGKKVGAAMPGTSQPPVDPASMKRGEMPVGGSLKTLGEMLPEFTPVGGEAALNAGREVTGQARHPLEAIYEAIMKSKGAVK